MSRFVRNKKKIRNYDQAPEIIIARALAVRGLYAEFALEEFISGQTPMLFDKK